MVWAVYMLGWACPGLFIVWSGMGLPGLGLRGPRDSLGL